MAASRNRESKTSQLHLQTGLIGAAGEYYVAAELSRRGWLATVTVKNAPGTDVLAKDRQTGFMVSIQTKTTTGSRSFLLSKRDEEKPAEGGHEWYALVQLRERREERPNFYVIPRAIARGEQTRWRDTGMRTIERRDVEAWNDRWDLLGTRGSELPELEPTGG
jgi:hypothetical protein